MDSTFNSVLDKICISYPEKDINSVVDKWDDDEWKKKLDSAGVHCKPKNIYSIQYSVFQYRVYILMLTIFCKSAQLWKGRVGL